MSSMENLPSERELERKFPNVPPWQHLHQPKIVTSLLDKKITKEAEPNILKLCAQETVNSYSTSAIHAYTDGSAFKATINAGYGILLKYPDGSSSEYSDSCGTNCSNYEAEKIGATKPQKIPPCTQNTIKQILKNNEKEDWLNRWACGSTGRVMFKEMAQPRPQDAINELERQDQSLIFQHTRTNQHLNRIDPLHQPHCRHCDNPAETTEHLLLYCPNLQSKRMELLPTNPTIHSTLYGQLDQLKKTSTFIRLALTVQE